MSTGTNGCANETLLQLKLIGAQNLKKSRHGAKQSPYCVVTPLNSKEEPFDDEVLLSKVARKQGQNPQWNQKALTKLTSSHKSWINVDIWSHKAGSKDSFLGRARVPLSTVINHGQDKLRLDVVKSNGSTQGYLDVELTFISVTAATALQDLEADLEKSVKKYSVISQGFVLDSISDEIAVGRPVVDAAEQPQVVYNVVGVPAANTVPSTENLPPTGGFEKPCPPRFRRPSKEEMERAKRMRDQSNLSANAQQAAREYCQPFKTHMIFQKNGKSYYCVRPSYRYYCPFLFLFLMVPFFWPFLVLFPFFLLLSQ